MLTFAVPYFQNSFTIHAFRKTFYDPLHDFPIFEHTAWVIFKICCFIFTGRRNTDELSGCLSWFTHTQSSRIVFLRRLALFIGAHARSYSIVNVCPSQRIICRCRLSKPATQYCYSLAYLYVSKSKCRTWSLCTKMCLSSICSGSHELGWYSAASYRRVSSHWFSVWQLHARGKRMDMSGYWQISYVAEILNSYLIYSARYTMNKLTL